VVLLELATSLMDVFKKPARRRWRLPSRSANSPVALLTRATPAASNHSPIAIAPLMVTVMHDQVNAMVCLGGRRVAGLTQIWFIDTFDIAQESPIAFRFVFAPAQAGNLCCVQQWSRVWCLQC